MSSTRATARLRWSSACGRRRNGVGGTLTPIGPADSVRLVTNDFMYTGGDGYTVFSQGTNVQQPGDALLDVVVDSITANSPVDPVVDGRIVGPVTADDPTTVRAWGDRALTVSRLDRLAVLRRGRTGSPRAKPARSRSRRSRSRGRSSVDFLGILQLESWLYRAPMSNHTLESHPPNPKPGSGRPAPTGS